MGIIQNSNYSPPILHLSKHFATVYPALFRKIKTNWKCTGLTIFTEDKDFIDIDYYTNPHTKKLVVISHGLEGNSKRPYVLGMAMAFIQRGFNVAAWNFRGCSGRMNQTEKFYHSGSTNDLDTVINYFSKFHEEIYLVGFSLGGNLTLKYLGENWETLKKVGRSVVFSVPMHLESGSAHLNKPSNMIYSKRFLKTLKKKVIYKKSVMNVGYSITGIDKIRTLFEFDDHFTAPIHHFKDAKDYYAQSSSIHYLKHISKPTLVINALNDPFLSKECFPFDDFKKNDYIYLETPKYGGHVGFYMGQHNYYWSEQRALEFICANQKFE